MRGKRPDSRDQCYSNQLESPPERGAFRPVIVEKRAVGIEQEPLVMLYGPIIVKPKATRPQPSDV